MADPQTPAESFERVKWTHDRNREEAHRAHDRNTAAMDAANEITVKTADSALRLAMLINGGAAVSMLAFIGGLASQDRIKIADLKDVSSSLVIFAIGVALSVGGMAFAYFTHYYTVGVG